MTKLYVIWNNEENKITNKYHLNSENILLCMNPFNKENDITNTSKTSNNYTILYFDRNLILKMLRLKNIKEVIISNPTINYTKFTEGIKTSSNYNSMKFYYELTNNKYDKTKLIKVLRNTNNIIFQNEDIFEEYDK